MVSNNYNTYGYTYRRSSTHEHSADQTSPDSNSVAQSSRQHQQPTTIQGQNYNSYRTQPSNNQKNDGYGKSHDISGNGRDHGETRETTSRAAEALHNMSTVPYMPDSNLATNKSRFVATTTAGSYSGGYDTGTGASGTLHRQAQMPLTQPPYGNMQPRLRSVNTNHAQTMAWKGPPASANATGYSSQTTQMSYNQQQQRTSSPAQRQYNTTPVDPVRLAALHISADQRHDDYSRRQLPSGRASGSIPVAASSKLHSHAHAPAQSYTQVHSGPIAPPAPSSSISDTYSGQSATTVDPTAVYDPWLEYQRKQDTSRAQKAREDAAITDNKRATEESQRVEEGRKAEGSHQKEKEKQQQSMLATNKSQTQQSSVTEADVATPGASEGLGETLEAEIRATMAKMRELNNKDPALLARIWEEERRAKGSKSPNIQNKVASQATAAQPQVVQADTIENTNSRKPTVSKEQLNANVSKPANSNSAQDVIASAQVPSKRPAGNNVWPPDKKIPLAEAAATFLNGRNHNIPLDPTQILRMLDNNPSYVELCEQLEQMGLKLDRAAFAKHLLSMVPEVNQTNRKVAPQPSPIALQRPQAPTAVMKQDVGRPVAASAYHTSVAASPANRDLHPPLPNIVSRADAPMLVAEMVPIKPESKPPANKAEAARKRHLSDLVDLTLLSDDDDMGPPPKRIYADPVYAIEPKYPHGQDPIAASKELTVTNFPSANVPSYHSHAPVPPPSQSLTDLRHRDLVDCLDRKRAIRRNTYNPATIARDVLLACGRHPSERQLNQHLDGLRTTLPQISFDSDLSTIRWDIIDPGHPPPGYFRDGVQALTEDADDESESDYAERKPHSQTPWNALIGKGGAGEARVQALPEAINPFKQKRRGRPPRQSLPNDTSIATPKRPSNTTTMSASAPRPTTAGAGVGYQAFRSATQYGPDGQPLPKKRGRPVGWRKAIHGSTAAQAQMLGDRFTGTSQASPSQLSSLHKIRTGEGDPIVIDSRSSSVVNRIPQYPSYKCKWQNCKAELHNLETLRKHVFKVHRKETLGNTLDCLWADCGKAIMNVDPTTALRIEQKVPYNFDLQSDWHTHIQQNHFDPLSWELGDGPASGLSGNEDN